MALINSLCAMLRSSPFHRENYSRLILGVIIQFYQRCSDRFQDLVAVRDIQGSNLEPTLALAAQWAQRSELSACISELLTTSVSYKIPGHLTTLILVEGYRHGQTATAISPRDEP